MRSRATGQHPKRRHLRSKPGIGLWRVEKVSEYRVMMKKAVWDRSRREKDAKPKTIGVCAAVAEMKR